MVESDYSSNRISNHFACFTIMSCVLIWTGPEAPACRRTDVWFTHLSLDLTDEPCGEILADRLAGSRLVMIPECLCLQTGETFLPQTCSRYCTQTQRKQFQMRC